MCGDKESSLKREKDIKSKLVKTRKIIQEKFNKAYKNRIDRESELIKKYHPITDAIGKLNQGQTSRAKLKSPDIQYGSYYGDRIYDEVANSEVENAYDNDFDSLGYDDWTSDSEDESMDYSERQSNIVEDINIPGPSHATDQKKRTREDDRHSADNISNLSDGSETLIKPTADGKKSRLSKTAIDKGQEKVDKKINKKLQEMRKVDDIFVERNKINKEKADERLQNYYVIPSDVTDTDSDSNSAITVDSEEDEIPGNRHPSTKRKAPS